MPGSVQSGLLAQNGNSTVTWSIGASPRVIWTAMFEGGSAVGVRRHNSLPDNRHHLNVEVVGGTAATFRLGGYVV